METPSVTQVQAGAGGAFVAILTLAIQANITGTDLLVIAASSAIVALGAMISDAIIRSGRARIVASELHGVQSTLAAFDRPAPEGDS